MATTCDVIITAWPLCLGEWRSIASNQRQRMRARFDRNGFVPRRRGPSLVIRGGKGKSPSIEHEGLDTWEGADARSGAQAMPVA